MTRFYRNKVSGAIWPEFARGSSQENFPKDWELVEAVAPEQEVIVESDVELSKPVIPRRPPTSSKRK